MVGWVGGWVGDGVGFRRMQLARPSEGRACFWSLGMRAMYSSNEVSVSGDLEERKRISLVRRTLKRGGVGGWVGRGR